MSSTKQSFWNPGKGSKVEWTSLHFFGFDWSAGFTITQPSCKCAIHGLSMLKRVAAIKRVDQLHSKSPPIQEPSSEEAFNIVFTTRCTILWSAPVPKYESWYFHILHDVILMLSRHWTPYVRLNDVHGVQNCIDCVRAFFTAEDNVRSNICLTHLFLLP